jgi:serine/threonine protein phosphatase 1
MPLQTTKLKVQHLPANTEGRDFVVGDLHGCLEDLLIALKAVDFNEEIDRLFAVGDLIDRGPYSKECAQLIYQTWFYSVRGNHEQMMIDCLLHDQDPQMWMINGGLWYYNEDPSAMKSLAYELDHLPIVIVVGEGTDRFNIVHAEFASVNFQTGRKIKMTDTMISHGAYSDYDVNQMLWGRTLISNGREKIEDVRPDELWHDLDKMSLTFCGHTPVRYPVQCQQQMYLDNGAVYHHTSANKSEANQLVLACPTTKQVYAYNMLWKTMSTIPFDQLQKMG